MALPGVDRGRDVDVIGPRERRFIVGRATGREGLVAIGRRDGLAT